MELLVEEKGQNNLAFAILLQLGDSTACVDLLTKTQRAPEAALFARTYAPRYIFFISTYLIHLFFLLIAHIFLFILVKHQKQFKPGNRNSPPKRELRLQLPSLILLQTLNYLKRDGRKCWLARRLMLTVRFVILFYF
jgi:Coatomer WD associated region